MEYEKLTGDSSGRKSMGKVLKTRARRAGRAKICSHRMLPSLFIPHLNFLTC